jgi:hypothetical protein
MMQYQAKNIVSLILTNNRSNLNQAWLASLLKHQERSKASKRKVLKGKGKLLVVAH